MVRDLRRNVEPFAQQVHADEHVEFAELQIADDLDSLQSVDITVQIKKD